MKKALLSTSAIALVAVAAPATAAEWEVRIGGYAEMELAYGTTDIEVDSDFASIVNGDIDFEGLDSDDLADLTSLLGFDPTAEGVTFGGLDLDLTDPDVDGVGLHRDMEATLTASITLDNGLQFGAQAELELETTTTNNTDENEVFIEGAFGEIVLGNEDAAGERMAFVAPDVGIIAANSGTMSEFIRYDLTPGYTGGSFLLTSLNETFQSDATGITYFTPRLAGVQLGVSYFRTPDGGQDESLLNDLNDDDIAHSVSFGANFVQNFGGFDVAVSGFYSFAQAQQAGDEDPEIYGFGVNVGFAGFTVGGSWGEGNDLDVIGDVDGRGWDVGVSYETGPFAVSAAFFRGETSVPEGFVSLGILGSETVLSPVVDGEGTPIADTFVESEEDIGGSVDLPGYDEEINLINISGTYTLAQGVVLVVEGGYADYENDVAEADGFFIGTGVDLSF
ncbi:MAG: porin [Pseudomonadota bacterium]